MIRLSSDAYPESERLDGWREEFGYRVIKTDIDRLDDPQRYAFRATTDCAQIGNILFTRTVGTPVRFSRDKRLAEDGDDSFSFLLNRRGAISANQAGSSFGNTTPGLLMLDHGRPFNLLVRRAQSPSSNEPPLHDAFAFAVPRDVLLAAAPNVETFVGKACWKDPEILDYLIHYAEEFMNDGGPADQPAIAKTMGDHIFDLIALLVGPSRETLEIASRRGLRAARVKAILAYVRRNLGNPSLGAQMIAEHQKISSRYVSKLMEEQGETLSALILRLRLAKVGAMLSDPANRAMRVSDIAYSCGFSDLSYFNRAFRRAFGSSPRQYRA